MRVEADFQLAVQRLPRRAVKGDPRSRIQPFLRVDEVPVAARRFECERHRTTCSRPRLRSRQGSRSRAGPKGRPGAGAEHACPGHHRHQLHAAVRQREGAERQPSASLYGDFRRRRRDAHRPPCPRSFIVFDHEGVAGVVGIAFDQVRGGGGERDQAPFIAEAGSGGSIAVQAGSRRSKRGFAQPAVPVRDALQRFAFEVNQV